MHSISDRSAAAVRRYAKSRRNRPIGCRATSSPLVTIQVLMALESVRKAVACRGSIGSSDVTLRQLQEIVPVARIRPSKRLEHLDAFFVGRRLANIGGADAAAYVAHRRKEEATNGTINREPAVLGRMLRLAYENGKLLRLPVIRKLKEAPPRSGFLEVAQFEAVCRHLPEDLRVAVTVGTTS